MKIIALTDIHDAIDTALRIMEKESDADLFIFGGDLTTNGGPAQMEKALNKLLALSQTSFALAGNMDRPETADVIEARGISLHGRGIIHRDVGIFGVGGCPKTPMNTPNELSEEEIGTIIVDGYDAVRTAKRKIFVTHTPPADTKLDRISSGQHVGSISVRMFIEYEQPDMVICGHIHEARGQDILGASRLINCGPAFKGFYGKIILGEKIEIANAEL